MCQVQLFDHIFQDFFACNKVRVSHDEAFQADSLTTVHSEIFARFFIFANSVERHICDVKNSRLVHDFPSTISISDRMISSFREDFNSRN